jgi:formyl-CoA transferase
MLGIPYRFSDTPAGVDLAPPLLGADTDAILGTDLGLDEATITRYREEGVI